MTPSGGAAIHTTVIIPAYQEERIIADVVRGCTAVPGVDEVLVVDDGSRDATSARAAEAGARVVRQEPNRGKGAAVRRGIAEAKGDVLVFIDGDGQDDPADMPKLLAAIEDGADMVVGSRFIGHFGPGAITPINKLGNQFLTEVANVLFRARLTDTLAGFRAVRREALSRVRLRSENYDIEVDLLLQMVASGARVVEVPVRRECRPHGASKLNAIVDGTRILRRIIEIRLGRI